MDESSQSEVLNWAQVTRVSWPTSSFSITNGQINSDGQFTATLTGMDDDSDVPLNESVRGFMGEIVGRFFGPNAEELGGAVNASRDVTGADDDRSLYGYIAVRQLESLENARFCRSPGRQP